MGLVVVPLVRIAPTEGAMELGADEQRVMRCNLQALQHDRIGPVADSIPRAVSHWCASTENARAMFITDVSSMRALSSRSRLSNSKRSASVIAESSKSSIRWDSVELWCACGSS